MFRIARLFLSLGQSQIGEFRDQTKRRLIFGGLLGFFFLIAFIFGLIALTAWLTQKYGLIAASGIIGGGAILCALIAFIAMKAAERRHRALAAERAELQHRLSQLAMLTAFGAARPKTGQLIGLGVAAAAILLLLGRFGGGKPGDD